MGQNDNESFGADQKQYWTVIDVNGLILTNQTKLSGELSLLYSKNYISYTMAVLKDDDSQRE